MYEKELSEGETWYAKHGRKAHLILSEWTTDGKGACGENVSRIARAFRFDGAFRQACEHIGVDPTRSMCKRCLRLVVNEG